MNDKKIKCGTLFVLITMLVALTGCNHNVIPKDALKLEKESLEKRSLQTRRYEGISEVDILSASAAVIQDLGFNIDESETSLGIIVGSKERDATETGQVIGAVFFAILFGVSIAIDKNQKLRVSLVVRPTPANDDKKHFARVTFQRIVWNTQGHISKIEGLEEPELYQEFFDRLSKSVFLEGHKI
ncbi:MAG: hypothetical protein O7D86_03060 [Proteobacteria bacterium]|nr:hypothetical protein [Pseudomonadota bacterium]